MRLIHISSSSKQGGGPWHILSLIESISPHEIEQFSIIPTAEGISELIISKSSNAWKYPRNILELIALAYKLLRIKADYSTFILHSHGPGAAVLGKLLKLITGAYHFYTPHGVQFTSYRSPKKLAYLIYEMLTSSLLDHIIFISYSEHRVFKKHSLFRSNPFNIIENVVNPSKILFLSPDHLLGSNNNQLTPPTVGMVGRLTIQKNSLLIFKLAKLLPNIKFIYIGEDGELSSEFLDCLYNEKLPNITYIPHTNEITNFYSKIDILIAPSVHEGLPYVVIEALCNYIPVVCSCIQPFVELYSRFNSPMININPDVSVNCSISYAKSFAQVLTRINIDNRYHNALHYESQRLVSHYSNNQQWISSYMQTYKRAC